MTPNEYLESSLKSERGISDDISARNRVRMLLTTFFNKRDCACLPRPVTDESELSQLGQEGSRAAFRPAFNEKLQALRSQVLAAALERPKRLNGTTLRGPQLAKLVAVYVEALNAGQVPTVAHAWQAVQQLQAQSAFAKALAEFERAASSDPKGDPWEWPVPPGELEDSLGRARQAATEILRKNVLEAEQEETVARLGAALDEVASKLVAKNQAAAMAAVVATLEQGWAPTQEAVRKAELSGCDAVLAKWGELRRSVAKSSGESEAVQQAMATFCVETVLVDVSTAGRNEAERLTVDLAAERGEREKAQAEVIAMTEKQQQGLEEARAVRDAETGEMRERLEAALAAQREEAHVTTLRQMEHEKSTMELKLKAQFHESEIERLRDATTRIEKEKDEVQKALDSARQELAKANEVRAELAGQLAVLRPQPGAPSAVQPPPGSPARETQPSEQGTPQRSPSTTTAAAGASAESSGGPPGPVMTAEMLKAVRSDPRSVCPRVCRTEPPRGLACRGARAMRRRNA